MCALLRTVSKIKYNHEVRTKSPLGIKIEIDGKALRAG